MILNATVARKIVLRADGTVAVRKRNVRVLARVDRNGVGGERIRRVGLAGEELLAAVRVVDDAFRVLIRPVGKGGERIVRRRGRNARTDPLHLNRAVR